MQNPSVPGQSLDNQPSTSTSSPTTPAVETKPQTPLAEAQVESIDELFSRDPEGYGDQELDRVIAGLLKQREIWQKAEAAGAKKAPKAAGTKSTKPVATDLADLGLDG